MSYEWKDAKGRPCRLVVEVYNGESAGHVATTADLLRALGLSTEGGPTDEELLRIEDANLLPDSVARRALCNAGRASREASILGELSEAFGERKRPFTSLDEARESVRGIFVALRDTTVERDTARAEVDRLTARVAELKVFEAELGRVHSRLQDFVDSRLGTMPTTPCEGLLDRLESEVSDEVLGRVEELEEDVARWASVFHFGDAADIEEMAPKTTEEARAWLLDRLETDRGKKRRLRERAETAEAELAATKEKLAEVERERDTATAKGCQ